MCFGNLVYENPGIRDDFLKLHLFLEINSKCFTDNKVEENLLYLISVTVGTYPEPSTQKMLPTIPILIESLKANGMTCIYGLFSLEKLVRSELESHCDRSSLSLEQWIQICERCTLNLFQADPKVIQDSINIIVIALKTKQTQLAQTLIKNDFLSGAARLLNHSCKSLVKKAYESVLFLAFFEETEVIDEILVSSIGENYFSEFPKTTTNERVYFVTLNRLLQVASPSLLAKTLFESQNFIILLFEFLNTESWIVLNPENVLSALLVLESILGFVDRHKGDFPEDCLKFRDNFTGFCLSVLERMICSPNQDISEAAINILEAFFEIPVTSLI